ncbi:MAG: thioredoxin family protein [Candidatus Thiodiazotropha sp. (ex Notomyrtea botanica)]|nr:thioredoxin family protein [Candidatus Thiodiazotropha sp. (ex Notomyrtea botanica)]
MSWVMIVLLAASAFLILMPMLTYLSARRMVGTEIESGVLDKSSGDRMIYFYSANCGPCRSMTPIIDRLAQESDRVTKIDVRDEPEAARAFKIRATPTTILVKDNRVLDVTLGAKTEKQLEALLQRVA